MKQKKKLILLLFLIGSTFCGFAQQKEYKASMFGIKSDGKTLNTRSIQKAIDFISEQGGGQLTFWVGRYRTGTIHLKSNVTIEIREGAALLASTSPYDYDFVDGAAALLIAKDQDSIRIFGKGLIEGNGEIINPCIDEQSARGNLPKGQESFRPALIRMNNCSHVTIEGLLFQNAGGHVQEYTNCKQLQLSGLTINSRVTPVTKGIVLNACQGFSLKDSFLDTSSTPVFLGKGTSGNVTLKNTQTPGGKKIQATR